MRAPPHLEMMEPNKCLSPKLVIVMVGLPARGKSYISEKLARYLNWLQYETRVFNVGQNRRKLPERKMHQICDGRKTSTDGSTVAGEVSVNFDEVALWSQEKEFKHPASFFDPKNGEALKQREEIALTTLDELLDWLLNGNGCAAIFDATNSTVQRRTTLYERVRERGGSKIELLFLESCCYDPDILEKNVHLKLSGPDYKGQDPRRALTDFRRRISEYEKSYVPLGDFEESWNIPYLKLINIGSKIIAYKIHGLLSERAVEYLLNFHVFNRRIWITRNGESLDDVVGIIGRDSILSEKGGRFALALAKLVESQRNVSGRNGQVRIISDRFTRVEGCKDVDINTQLSPGLQTAMRCRVWTSTMTQAIQTSQSFDKMDYEVMHLKELDDLNAGRMEGLTFAQIEKEYPKEMAQRRQNPLRYRWPGLGGEGYVDIINRLRSLVIELERSRDDIVLITHSPVARVLLAYFRNLGRENLAEIQVPLGTVYAVTPQPYGVAVDKYVYSEHAEQFFQREDS